MKTNFFPRILISLLGVAFTLWSVGCIVLAIFGVNTSAVVTDIRREGGERSDIMPNRYTYNISYTFTLPNGEKVDGSVKKVAGAVYIKADSTDKIAVRYLKVLPYINTTEESLRSPIKWVVLAGIGVLLVVLMNLKKKNTDEP